ncbi:MAG: DUF2779 domain-containing protein [Spirochaetales bacterium]
MNFRPLTEREFLIGGRCLRRLYEERRIGETDAQAATRETGYAARFTAEQADRVRSLAMAAYRGSRNYELGVDVSAAGCHARVEILERRENGSVRPLVTCATYHVKPQTIERLRYQLFVLEQAGYSASGGGAVCLVKDRERGGEIEPESVLVERDCSKQLRGGMKAVKARITRIQQMLGGDDLPPPCSDSEKCPVCSGVTDRQSDGTGASVDTRLEALFRGGGVVGELRKAGYRDLLDVPPSQVPGRRQKLQLETLQSGSIYIDRPALEAFLSELHYPRVYLDFETVSQAIPPLPGVKPWEHVPVQFSVHRQEEPESSPRHLDYVAEGLAESNDPRRGLAASLAEALQNAGSVLVYSAAFERRVLQRLAYWVPDFADVFHHALGIIKDVQKPFVDFLYYDPRQGGRTGLKTVLPVMTGDKGHERLEISDGLEASLRWYYEYCEGCSDRNASQTTRSRVRAELTEYCALDTEGLVHIVDRFEAIVHGAEHVEKG